MCPEHRRVGVFLLLRVSKVILTLEYQIDLREFDQVYLVFEAQSRKSFLWLDLGTLGCCFLKRGNDLRELLGVMG